jgi:hypothetical protein
LSRQIEHFEGSSTLTPPQLNPLQNPLLAQNMGRWAQVYFTSPPERREQAVQELLRELEAENSTRVQTVGAGPSPLREQRPELLGLADSRASEEPTVVRCHACGRNNASSQKFCGMCGARLGEESAVADLHRDDAHEGALHIADLHIADQPMEDLAPLEPAPYLPNQQSRFVPRNRDVYEQKLNTNELSLLQSGRDVDYYKDKDGDEIFSVPRSPGSYRIYVGVVLAIVIGALAYMAWRSTQASQTSQVESLAPPVASKEPATAAPAPPSPAKTDTPDSTPTAENQADPSRDAAKPVRNEASSKADNTAPALPHGTSRPETAAATEVSAGTGGEELALAQHYLSGTNGQGRNSAEAAKWLWKAIAKHNGEATLLLSDLYLRGDGVSKNCDQARVLLDSAALKGVKDAGERLRHLPAFGCE